MPVAAPRSDMQEAPGLLSLRADIPAMQSNCLLIPAFQPFKSNGKGKNYPVTCHEWHTGEAVIALAILDQALEEVGGQLHASTVLPPRKGPHFIERCLGPRLVWAVVQKLVPTGIRSPDRPTLSVIQTLYRLS